MRVDIKLDLLLEWKLPYFEQNFDRNMTECNSKFHWRMFLNFQLTQHCFGDLV